MARRALLLFLFAAAIFATNVGCGSREPDMPELGIVRGTITLDGNPMPKMTIFFEPDEGRKSIATSDADGIYKAMYFVDQEGVKVGPCTARVTFGLQISAPPVPPRYSSESELKFEVKPGENTFDIAMTSN